MVCDDSCALYTPRSVCPKSGETGVELASFGHGSCDQSLEFFNRDADILVDPECVHLGAASWGPKIFV